MCLKNCDWCMRAKLFGGGEQSWEARGTVLQLPRLVYFLQSRVGSLQGPEVAGRCGEFGCMQILLPLLEPRGHSTAL